MTDKDYNFKEKYLDLKDEYPDIIELDDSTLEEIQLEISKENKKKRTNGYLLAVYGASLTIILYPFVIVKIFRALEKTSALARNIINLIPENNINIYNFSLGFGGIAILMYLFLFPSFSFFGKVSPSKTSFAENINKGQPNYVLTSILGVYLVIGFSCFIFMLNSEKIWFFFCGQFQILPSSSYIPDYFVSNNVFYYCNTNVSFSQIF